MKSLYFERGADGTWQEKQKLLASDAAASNNFGISVAITGNYAIVGSKENSAYIFERGADGKWGKGFRPNL